MGKCPLCGSDGDDLVFRFYCSSPTCVNYVPEKTDEHKDGGEILRPGEVFRLSEPKFVGSFPVRDAPIVDLNDEFEYLQWKIIEGLRVPKEFFSDDRYRREVQAEWPVAFPEFTLERTFGTGDLDFTWRVKVPAVLSTLIEPLLCHHLGEPLRSSSLDKMRKEITHYLLGMVEKDELVWNSLRNRWELHFTE